MTLSQLFPREQATARRVDKVIAPSVFPPDGPARLPLPRGTTRAIQGASLPVEAPLFLCAALYVTRSSFCSERSGLFIGVSGKLVFQLV